ncbi:hypothetical protein OFB80_32575, partial [Escherichia coli]|nr:hypothetical protein [Escherichia coli]
VALFGFIIARRKKKREQAAAAADSAEQATAQPARKAAPAGSYPAISAGAEEVVRFLKSSDLGSGGREAVYALPWYLVAGHPKSG